MMKKTGSKKKKKKKKKKWFRILSKNGVWMETVLEITIDNHYLDEDLGYFVKVTDGWLHS